LSKKQLVSYRDSLEIAWMPAEARVTKLWIQQKGLIPLMFIVFSLYFAWDGFIGYPRSDKRFEMHQQLKDKPGEWEKLCKENGWKTTPPEKLMGPGKYLEQRIFAAITGLIGIGALIYWMRQRRTIVKSDDEAVYTPSGIRVPYGSITRVEKQKWKEKGLAYVSYTLDGAKGKFTLDDAKHDPKALEQVLTDIVERSSNNTQIVS
jgi:hypothetical protein